MAKKASRSTLNFIDIFSGAGGLSCGLEMAGLRCLLGVDFNKHAMETFKVNHHYAETYCGPIEKLDDSTLRELIKNKPIHAVVGGPPCQGFSTVGPGNPNDKRNSLFKHFVRIVKSANPNFVVIENVTGLLAKKNEKTLKAIFKEFNRLGFNMGVQVLSSQQYGVPEKRRRTILIGTKLNPEPTFPIPTHDITKGGKYIGPVTVGEAFEEMYKNKNLPNHDIPLAKISNPLELKRIKRIPEGKGVRYQKDELQYFTPSLRLNVDWENLKENRFRQTKYLRLDRKLPSPTIMTHRHSYYHPFEHRFLTQREAAKCQSFPDNFEFKGPLTAQWRQIGNAVPPLLGKAIGKMIKKMVKEATLSPNGLLPKGPNIKNQIHNIRGKAFNYRPHSSTT